MRRDDGQATVEFVAMLPLLGVLALGVWQAAVAGHAIWSASAAARSASRVAALGGDAEATVRRVAGRRARVRDGGRRRRPRHGPDPRRHGRPRPHDVHDHRALRAAAMRRGSPCARRRAPPRDRSRPGQSTLETVAVLPLMITVALAIGHVLAAGLAHELAGHAAQAGAIAVIRGGDAKASVAAALPEWARGPGRRAGRRPAACACGSSRRRSSRPRPTCSRRPRPRDAGPDTRPRPRASLGRALEPPAR